MRILFVVENYHPHVGGAEVVFRTLAEELAKRGHNVTVLTHRVKNSRKRETLNGVAILRTGSSRHIFSFAAIPQAIALARKADIIHTTTFNGALPAWIAARVTGKKLVITVHEVWIGMWKQLGDTGRVQKLFYDIAERFVYMLDYDCYVAVSDSTSQQLHRLGIDKGKVQTIHNAVDYNHFNPKKYGSETIRRKYGLGKRFVYLCYGRPGVSKGMEYAVKAAALVKEKIPESRFVLVLSKDAAYRKHHQRITQLIRQLQLGSHILLLPPAPWSEVPQYLNAADCVVVPSLAEGFGFTAAEAVAMGVPVVATNTTSLPEVVSGKYVLVEPKSSRAIAEAVEAVHLGKYKRTKRKVFSVKSNVDSYLSVYRKLSGKNR
jgi:D-inositol-3-phosphate glycosyltransferase